MQFNEWIKEAFERISQELVNCYDNAAIGGWEEDRITTQALIAFKSLGLELVWDDKPQKVKWECHKLKGHLESHYGDIAVIVKVWIAPKVYIEGVAFYEAKKQYFDKAHQPEGFKAIKLEQLTRITALTHASHVILYDVNIDKRRAGAMAVSTPIVTELARKNKIQTVGRFLLYYGQPWPISLGNNLLGLHLDFRKEAVETIKNLGYSSAPPAFIVNAAIGLDKLLEPVLENAFINDNFYDQWLTIETPDTNKETEQDQDKGKDR